MSISTVDEAIEVLESMDEASHLFISFMEEYPENNACVSFRRAVEVDAADRWVTTASPFEEAVFRGEINEAYRRASPKYESQLEDVFPHIVG